MLNRRYFITSAIIAGAALATPAFAQQNGIPVVATFSILATSCARLAATAST